MFKKFFQRKPKISDKDRQLEHISTLDSSSPQHLSQLLELAKTDPDPNIRSAAASRIGLRDCLAGLLKTEQDQLVRSRLIKLLFKQCTDEDAVEIASNLLRHAADDPARIALLADVQQPAAATFIATRIQDPQALIDTAVSHKVSRVRLAAAQQLSDEAQLQELSHKATDKSVNQWVRAQLKELKDQRQQAEQEQVQVQKLVDDCQQLAQSENPVDYRQRTNRLQIQHDALQEHVSAEHASTLRQLFEQCETRAVEIELKAQQAHAPEQSPEKNQLATETQAEVVAEPVVETDPQAQERAQLHTQLTDLLAQRQVVPTVETIRALLDKSATDWQALGEEQAEHPYHQCVRQLQDAAISQEYLAANGETLNSLCETPLNDELDDDKLHALLSNTKDYLEVLSWPDSWAIPPALQALRTTQSKAKALLQQRRQHSRLQAQKLDKKIHRLGEAVRRKNLRLANNIHREVQQSLPKITGREQQKLQQHLDKHLPEFDKLLDWHEYSAAPKKEELCAQMEALIEREQPPEARAESVKALRAEWRTVTAANVQKDDPLWTRFNNAAETAYAPCEPFFEKLKQRKQENLQQRERLTGELEQLLAGTNWAEPPFDMLDKVLRTARAEWQQYTPVHFPDAKPCQKRFDAAMDKVHGALQNIRKSNGELREQLISRANALTEHDDVDSAIAQALKLQDEWKAIGPVTPQMQRKQWAVFRKSMDSVFARRQAARNASNAEQQAQRDEVNTLLDQLQSLAELPEEQLAPVADEVQLLAQQISAACEEMPKKFQSGLLRRQNSLLDTITHKQLSLPMRRRARAYANLAELAETCQRAESALQSGEPFDAIDISDSQWQSLMQARIDSLSNGNVDQLRNQQPDNLEALERLAIELEILAEVDTPDDYRGQRRAWQLDMLESGAINDGLQPEDKFLELLQRWHAVGAVDERSREQLTQRLIAASKPFAELLNVGTPAPIPAQLAAAPAEVTSTPMTAETTDTPAQEGDVQ